MSHEREHPVLTVSQAVREAAGAVDPTDTDGLVGDFEQWFEDDDEPVNTVPSLDRRIGGAVDQLDPDGTSPALAVAAAIVLYRGSQPHHPPHDADHLIEQAVRLQFGRDVPGDVAAWLAGER
jgi:hypothetical protein